MNHAATVSTHPPALRRSRGIGLVDGLVALAVLAFGMLAMTRFQSRLIAQSTEAQQRVVAMQFGDELLSTALVDVGNAACYTLPLAGVCGSATAQGRADAWLLRTLAALPTGSTAGSTLDVATNRLTVTITWAGRHANETRTMRMDTDVTP